MTRQLCVLLLYLFLPVVALAQSASDQELMSLNLEDLSRVKVFSASRHLEDAREAPSAVSIITAEEIRHYGWRTLGEALRSLRGFYTSYDRMYTYLGVRGFLRPGDYNSRILVMVNGHRINDNVYDSGPMELPIDLDLIDHIEVVRGPGSSLFGTNAVFGVVNVITRQAGGATGVELAGQTGSFLERGARVTVSGGKGSWSGLLSGTATKSAGQSRLFFPEFDTPGTNNGWAENADGARSDELFADLHHGGLRIQSLLGDRVKQSPTASYGGIFNDPSTSMRDTRGFLDAGYHRSLSRETDLDVRAYYDIYNYVGSGALPDPETGARFIAYSKARADWTGVEANLGRQIGKQRVTLGGDYEYSIDVHQRIYASSQPPVFESTQSPWRFGAYGEGELHLIPKVTLHAGGRLDWFSTFGSALSPRVAVIYSPSSRTALKYIFGKAFRAPNAYEEFYEDGITIAAPPKQLQPEQILSHEAVFERTLYPWLSLTVDGYYDQLQKLIDQVPDQSTGLSYFLNEGRVHGKGVELELRGQSAWGISARASYALAHTTNDLANLPLNNSARNQAKLNATFPMVHRAFGGVELLYQSAMEDYRGTRVPPFLLTNVTLSSKPMWGGWEFAFSCYNALDRRWFSPMGPSDPEASIQQDGRSYRFKVSYRLSEIGKRGGK